MRAHTRIVTFDPAPQDPWRPVATPIYQTATFDQESALEFGRFDYTRSGNPTRAVLEQHLAALDGGSAAFAFASGVAAVTAVTRLLRPGDEIVASDDLYGGTWRLLSQLVAERGIAIRYEPLEEPGRAEAALSARTRLVLVESISNPLQRVCDLRRLSALTRARGVWLCVDNTALSPYLQRPLELGADIVVHSATKHLCGHSDVTAGAVVVGDAALAERIRFIQNAEGAGLSPFESFLLLRGIKTLGVRLDRQQESARCVAAALAADPRVRRVRFPGLPGQPDGAVHSRQSSGPGTLVCFESDTLERSRVIVESLRLFNLAVSFGGVNSSASIPCCMSHASIPDTVRARREFPEALIRLSIGLEDPEDLIEDLSAALATAHGAPRNVPDPIDPSAWIQESGDDFHENGARPPCFPPTPRSGARANEGAPRERAHDGQFTGGGVLRG